MLSFKKSLARDLLAQANYLPGLRSHTDLVVEHFQSQNLLSLCLTTAILNVREFMLFARVKAALTYNFLSVSSLSVPSINNELPCGVEKV